MKVEKTLSVTFETKEVETLKTICEWALRYKEANLKKTPSGRGPVHTVGGCDEWETQRVAEMISEISDL